MNKANINCKVFLFGALGHLICWTGGDLLLYFVPNGPLNVAQLFEYDKTAQMLLGANPLQFTISGICGTIAMILALVGYYQIYRFLKPTAQKAAYIVAAGALLTCVAGAVMHFTCTSMLWYFVKSGATAEAHHIMLAFFTQTIATTVMCNIGVFMVCIPLFISVIRKKTCLPKWCCLINTIPLTIVAGIILAGIGAMNVGSCLMFFGLYFCTKRYAK